MRRFETKRSGWRDVSGFIRRHLIYLFSLLLFCCSTFFYLGAQQQRQATQGGDEAAFNDGATVTVVDVIDGDEVVIATAEGDRNVLRLLGIQSFDPTLSDPQLSEYGKTAFNFLRARALNKQGQLSLSGKRLVSGERLLGTLLLQDEQGAFTADLGKELVERGYSLVYIKYPFENEAAYLEAESASRDNLAGFWSDPIIVERIKGLKEQWQEARKE